MLKRKFAFMLTLVMVITALSFPAAAYTSPIVEAMNAYSDLQDRLNKEFPSVKTAMGTIELTHEVWGNATPTALMPHNIEIHTDWNPTQFFPSDIKNGLEISESSKKKTVQKLQEVQQKIYKIAMEGYSNKKIIGGFHSSYYKYPVSKVGYENIKFLSWKNYTGGYDIFSGKSTDIKIGGMHWNFLLDDYDFSEYMSNKKVDENQSSSSSVKESNVKATNAYKIVNQNALSLLSKETTKSIESFMSSAKKWQESIDISSPVNSGIINKGLLEKGVNLLSCKEISDFSGKQNDENHSKAQCVMPAAAVANEIATIMKEAEGKTTMTISKSKWNKLLKLIDEADNYYLSK